MIENYDPTWRESFALIAARARAALGELAITIEHVGSTAVPGLSAKPIIDLDAVVPMGTVRQAISRLDGLGYVHEGDLGIAGREAFKSPASGPAHHLYVVEEGSAELSRHLAFRDALRSSAALRDRYARLKRKLAERDRLDRRAYTEGKSEFIEATLLAGAEDSRRFCDALERGDLNALRASPKADLHTHGFAKADRRYVFERTGQDIEPVEKPLESMAAMHAWAERNIGTLFAGSAGRLLGIEANFVAALRDGLTRIEFGDDVWVVTQGLGSPRDLVDSILRVKAKMAPELEWIPQLGLSRQCAVSDVSEWMAPWLDLGFHQVLDMSGDELAQPIDVFAPLYRAAKVKGMRLKAHVGEWGTAEDVQRAVEVLELDEIQHGIAAADSPTVMRFLGDHRIRLNICPTSNLLLGRVKTLETHPIRRLFDAGVKVTVNTDDEIVFGVGVSEEFLRLYQIGLFTAAELDRIRLCGLQPSVN